MEHNRDAGGGGQDFTNLINWLSFSEGLHNSSVQIDRLDSETPKNRVIHSLRGLFMHECEVKDAWFPEAGNWTPDWPVVKNFRAIDGQVEPLLVQIREGLCLLTFFVEGDRSAIDCST